MKGKIEFIQQTEYDITDVEVSLEGLQEASGYHVHIVSCTLIIAVNMW